LPNVFDIHLSNLPSTHLSIGEKISYASLKVKSIKTTPNAKVINWFNNIDNNSLYISVLTIGEIQKGLEKTTDIDRKEKISTWLDHELLPWFDNRILDINRLIAIKWGEISSKSKQSLLQTV
jgi:predicted nucleic acid-binding protein